MLQHNAFIIGLREGVGGELVGKAAAGDYGLKWRHSSGKRESLKPCLPVFSIPRCPCALQMRYVCSSQK